MLRLRRLPPGLQLQALIQPPSRSPRARGRTLSSAPRDRRSKASLLAQISFGRCCSSGHHCPLAPLTRSCFGSPRPGRSLLLPTVPAASASRRIGSSSMAAAQRGARTPEVNGEQRSPSRTRDAGKSWRFAAASSAALAFPSRSRSDLQYGQVRRRLSDRPSVFSGVAVAAEVDPRSATGHVSGSIPRIVESVEARLWLRDLETHVDGGPVVDRHCGAVMTRFLLLRR